MESWLYGVLLLWCVCSHQISFHIHCHLKAEGSFIHENLYTFSDSEMDSWPSRQWVTCCTPLRAEIQMYNLVTVSPTSNDPPHVGLCPKILCSPVPVGPCHSGSLLFFTMQVQRVTIRQDSLKFPDVTPPGVHRNNTCCFSTLTETLLFVSVCSILCKNVHVEIHWKQP